MVTLQLYPYRLALELILVCAAGCSSSAPASSIVGEWQADTQLYAFNANGSFFVSSFGVPRQLI
jgi:hypothetical protein